MKDTEIYELVLEEIKAMRRKLDNVEEVLNAEMRKAAPRRGLRMPAVIELEPPEKRAVLELMKSGRLPLSRLAHAMGVPVEEARAIAGRLVEKGYLKRAPGEGEDAFEVSLARRKTSRLPFDIWGSLEKGVG
jgi:DNA-binding MarR family transcriptional regulator